MHFSVLYFKENKKLDDINIYDLEDDFGMKFCYEYNDCDYIYNEETDEYEEIFDFEDSICGICDWFQLGGRWVDMLQASRGISSEQLLASGENANGYSVVEVKDLNDDFLKDIDELFYGVATETSYATQGDFEFDEFMTKLKNKELVGVISIIDCHD